MEVLGKIFKHYLSIWFVNRETERILICVVSNLMCDLDCVSQKTGFNCDKDSYFKTKQLNRF